MIIRDAQVGDVEAIYGLITFYAELDRMLFRQKADIYEYLQTFKVAELDGEIVGCSALQVVWSDLAEVKSLAVGENCKGKGVGKELVQGCLEKAKELGIAKVFALTLECGFFEKLGFVKIDKAKLPMKVWSDCAKCSKQDHCDEFSYIHVIDY